MKFWNWVLQQFHTTVWVSLFIFQNHCTLLLSSYECIVCCLAKTIIVNFRKWRQQNKCISLSKNSNQRFQKCYNLTYFLKKWSFFFDHLAYTNISAKHYPKSVNLVKLMCKTRRGFNIFGIIYASICYLFAYFQNRLYCVSILLSIVMTAPAL